MKTYIKGINITIVLLFFHISFIYCSSNNNKAENVKIISSRVLTGCISGNCDNGYGKFIYADGIEYIGFWKDGKREGYGTLTITNEPIGINDTNETIKNYSTGKINSNNNSISNLEKKNKREEINIKEHDSNAFDATIMAMKGMIKVIDSVKYIKEQTETQKRKSKKSLCEIKYNGYWKNNKRHGQGQMINANCSVVKGIWEDDILKR